MARKNSQEGRSKEISCTIIPVFLKSANFQYPKRLNRVSGRCNLPTVRKILSSRFHRAQDSINQSCIERDMTSGSQLMEFQARHHYKLQEIPLPCEVHQCSTSKGWSSLCLKNCNTPNFIFEEFFGALSQRIQGNKEKIKNEK